MSGVSGTVEAEWGTARAEEDLGASTSIILEVFPILLLGTPVKEVEKLKVRTQVQEKGSSQLTYTWSYTPKEC